MDFVSASVSTSVRGFSPARAEWTFEKSRAWKGEKRTQFSPADPSKRVQAIISLQKEERLRMHTWNICRCPNKFGVKEGERTRERVVMVMAGQVRPHLFFSFSLKRLVEPRTNTLLHSYSKWQADSMSTSAAAKELSRKLSRPSFPSNHNIVRDLKYPVCEWNCARLVHF